MSGIGQWLGDGAALIVAFCCWLLLRYVQHLPQMSHPWIHRAAIAVMYCAGVVLTVTTVGTWVIGTLQRAGGLIGGTSPGSGIGWALVTIGALSILGAVIVALVWRPDPLVAYAALAAPLILALAPGGIAHQVYAFTAAPASSLVSQIATWAGG